jgi:two-component system nitrogen regulation response regulator GlnG
MSSLLAIDDEAAILDCYLLAFSEAGYKVQTALSGAGGLEIIRSNPPEVILLDIDMPELSGLETYKLIRELDPKIPVIFVTGSGSTDTAIEAIRLGAFDYVLKPFRIDQLHEVVGRAMKVHRLMKVPAVMNAEGNDDSPAGDLMIGRCPAMQQVYKAIGRVAQQDVTVLVLGESGTGKELVARAIYSHSRRANGPFLAINCGAIPETLLESELFGHEKGSFTGATQRRIGKFEQCNGGTLFLDEVGEMTPLTQVKLLRLLQEQRFERVGGAETVQTNVRIIAATNVDLERAVEVGRFRRDLYYRLNVYSVSLPPLRERREDLPLLVEYFLKRYRKELDRVGTQIAPETMEMLRAYAWPGNLRELQSLLKFALLESTGPVIFPESLPGPVRAQPVQHTAQKVSSSRQATSWENFLETSLTRGDPDLYARWQAMTDRMLFERVLQHVNGNLSRAAKLLGIHRVTLRTKINALGIASEAGGADPEV